MKKTKLTRSLMAAASVVALSAVMYGCVHDGGDGTPPEPPVVEPDPPTAYEAGKAAILAATTAAAAQAAYDAVDLTAVTGAQAASLQAALASKLDMLAAAAAAAARQALVDAAMCMDGTQACVDAHQALVDALAADPTTTVPALAAARANLATVQSAKAAADAAAAAAAARQALVDAAAGCTEGTQACVDAHQALVDALAADDTTSEADLAAARANLATVTMAKADADAAAHRQGLINAAAMCTEGTQACVDAHQALVDALDADPTTSADDLDAARANLATVTEAKADADAARTAEETRQALVDAAMCMDATQECVDAHQALVDALDADETTTADDLAEAQANLASVQMAKGEADAAAARVQADMDTVNGAISAATTAIAGLTATSSAADVEAARALVTAAQTALDGVENLSEDQVASLQGMVDAIDTANLVAQETRIAAAEKAAEAERMAAAAAAATKAAGTKRKAIATESETASGTNDVGTGLGGSARTDADGTTTTNDTSDDAMTMMISRARGEAAKIEITDPDNAGEDDPKFEVAEMLSGGRQMLTRTMEANEDGEVMTEVVLVATDIAGPKATAFAMVADQALDVSSATGVAAVTPEVDNALAIAEDTTLTGDANMNLMFARSTTSGTLNYTRDNPVDGEPATVGVDEGLHDGTYNGAEGTYRCVAATGMCTVTFNDKGQVIGNSANWVFVPDKGATSDVPDADYLNYGFWLKRTADSDGAIEYNEVETFAGSSVAQTADLTGVAGSASYEGDAVGVYVHSVSNADGTEASATSGHFTADASLTATFGQVQVSATDADGTIAANMLNTVTGTIDNFVLSGGEGNVWSVDLSGDIAATPGAFSGTAKGGVGDGSFSGTFHGAVTAGTTPVHLEANDSVYPHSAVGEFNAGFTNGSVAGAFGVREQD